MGRVIKCVSRLRQKKHNCVFLHEGVKKDESECAQCSYSMYCV